MCREGEGRQQQQQAQGEDSYIGAIVDMSDAEDGEVVEEDGMFDMVYSGHCNKQGCKEVCPYDTNMHCTSGHGAAVPVQVVPVGQRGASFYLCDCMSRTSSASHTREQIDEAAARVLLDTRSRQRRMLLRMHA